MPYGRGFGMGRGFGFRGYSPPWPYVGRGRGGLPRCQAFFPYASAPAIPFYAAYPHGAAFSSAQGFSEPWPAPNLSSMTPNQELHVLKQQAEMLRQQLDQISDRVQELEENAH